MGLLPESKAQGTGPVLGASDEHSVDLARVMGPVQVAPRPMEPLSSPSAHYAGDSHSAMRTTALTTLPLVATNRAERGERKSKFHPKISTVSRRPPSGSELKDAARFPSSSATRRWRRGTPPPTSMADPRRSPESLLCLWPLIAFKPLDSLRTGEIALNGSQRKWAAANLGGRVTVSRYQPPADTASFNLVFLALDLTTSLTIRKATELKADEFGRYLKNRYSGQVISPGQIVSTRFENIKYACRVTLSIGADHMNPQGFLSRDTNIAFEAAAGRIKIVNQDPRPPPIIKDTIDLKRMGIGGLSHHIGIRNVRGMLLFGPPGNGKTMIARKVANLLNAKVQTVSGPSLLDPYFGTTERNVRELFEPIIKDQVKLGEKSPLHVIIFDEFDAIAMKRGRSSGSGHTDIMVNQLLTMMDGLTPLDNLLVFATTNRRDLIDEAFLRPGRLEIEIEIGLPDLAARQEILEIHTAKLLENHYLDGDVSIENLAHRTDGYSGAMLEGVVKSAVSAALQRNIAPNHLVWTGDYNAFKVLESDFVAAVTENILRHWFGLLICKRFRTGGVGTKCPRVSMSGGHAYTFGRLSRARNSEGKKKSVAWQHFTMVAETIGTDMPKAACNYCKKEYFANGGDEDGGDQDVISVQNEISICTRGRGRKRLRMLGPPSSEDWKDAKCLTEFLRLFYNATLKLSGAQYTTSNQFFHELVALQQNIMTMTESNDRILSSMAFRMLSKFTKYWSIM
ncbi:unnamed protein product [Linum tenue]|uniref:Vesicle-fusing ATPase n=1 Tax=Linum tenue TaxID=586396 RepID=A0AAV0HR43_9ROSI|nr:unnamed protein product [Linum tenue]